MNTQGMVKDDMVKKLNEFPDFKVEKNNWFTYLSIKYFVL